MEYFEDKKLTRNGLCSDPLCPCDETVIPVGQGYLYIPESCCNFRWDCRTQAELHTAAERKATKSGQFIIFGHGAAGPILVCEVGARKRELDLTVAAADARHWWETGQVPFRVTPRAGQPAIPYRKDGPTTMSETDAEAEGEPGTFSGILVLAAIAAAVWYFFFR